MMAAFQLFQPTALDDALRLLEEYGDDGWILAGGQDSFDWFKDRNKQPRAVIDINGIEGLAGIREDGDSIEIGALTSLTAIATNALIKERYGVLADAALRVASPQIRNVGTLGGNVSQDTRCWYYRSGLKCYRAGGVTCYAHTPEGQNREHCLFNSDRCVAVSPSDTATALVALDATMLVQSPVGQREIPAGDFFMGPGTDITRMTVLESDDILVAIRLPATWAGKSYYFEKVADRNTWDFALVSLAAVFDVADERIRASRIVCGGVECVPRRLLNVERLIDGEPMGEDTARRAAAIASEGAQTLNYNHFKVPLMENLVKRAIRDA
jgi:xanthine dehydrogenase YagS FAD-binding subunit